MLGSRDLQENLWNGLDPVTWEQIPKLIISTSAYIAEQNILVQHTEAVYLLRKFLIENVQRMYPAELKDVNINSVLHYT
jgi:hypothetical protein